MIPNYWERKPALRHTVASEIVTVSGPRSVNELIYLVSDVDDFTQNASRDTL